ncbi:MAG TPA: Yip1 family protein [Syntrophorhabdaceae bacterium]|nr:Yip1 family protein [Syntrophorhabdaceae bacterium]HQM80548.1 Yip1 family protein [Syntrophorhabdaceae bacterium]
MDLVGRVKAIILKPKDTWEQVKQEETTVKELYMSYAVILAIIPPVATFIGWSIVGMSFLGASYRIPFANGISYAVFHYVLSLIAIYAVAFIIDMLAPNFGSQKNMVNAMKVAVYSNTPIWIASILFIFPTLSPIVMIASLYSLYLLYLGLPILMETPKEKIVGYIIVVIIVSIIVFYLAGIIARLVIPGRGMMMP